MHRKQQQLTKNGLIGSNSSESFPGNEVESKCSARKSFSLKISNNALFLNLFLLTRAFIAMIQIEPD